MNVFPRNLLQLVPLVLALSLTCAPAAQAGVPLEVKLYRSVLVDFEKQDKKVKLVTLANTTKEDSGTDSRVTVPAGPLTTGALPPAPSPAAPSGNGSKDFGKNTNKFVAVELLSPYLLKLDGIRVGSTTMIIWLQGPGDSRPVKTFYDVQVIPSCDDLEAQLKEAAAGQTLRVQFIGDTAILSGTVVNDRTRDKAEKLAQACGFKVLNNITMDQPQQVLLQVKVAQVDRTALRHLGISALVKGSKGEGFLNLVGAPASTTNNRSSLINGAPGIVGNLPGLGSFDTLDSFQAGVSYFPAGVGAVLQALSTKGVAKILAEPNLLVRSGQEGNFLAGSRIPYSVLVSSGGTSTPSIVYETVGIKLRFKPEVLENGLIQLKIDPAEVSSIAGTLAANGYPIIDTRDVRTSVELRHNESLVLAGLLQEEQIKTMSKIPVLGDIPILGALFRSTQDDLKEKELVFFITPQIVQPTAPGIETPLPTDQEITPETEKELRWMPLGD
jgi:pilus assembly protein CpaC